VLCYRRTVRRNLNAVLAVAVALGGLQAARAAEVTRVVSGSLGPGAWVDVHLSLGWTHDSRRAAIKREIEGQATGGQIALRNDLVFRQTRDALHLRADVGVWRDLSLFLALPIVLADDRSLDFDRSACGFGAAPGCVDENNATILRDGILPGFGAPSFGLDSPHQRPFQHPSQTVFRGPTRKGLEYLAVGASWALLNQDRDFTHPTWIVRAEARFAVGADMRFDPLHAGASTSVGPGFNQFVFSTIFSRRLWTFEPYVGGWYLLPVATSGSPVSRDVLGKGAADTPVHRAGAEFGVEAAVWDDPRSQRRITFELGGRMELRMAGLEQGPLWEPLAGSPSCPKVTTACRRDVDVDLNGDGVVDPNPGTTHTPAYGVLGGQAGLGVRAGRYLRFRGLFGLSYEQDHFLTDARSGIDVYDIPGRRFRLEDGMAWNFLVEGGLLF
jgi:hypothetical protein